MSAAQQSNGESTGHGRWIRWTGAIAIIGSLLFLVSLGLQAAVPQPDSYQFNPALTSPQFIRDVIAPGLTVAGLATHLLLLAGVWLRDGGLGAARRYGRLALAGWGVTVTGVALTLAGYAGLFTLGQGTGIGSSLAGAGFALLVLLGIAVLCLGVFVWGIALVRWNDRLQTRIAGVLLLSIPIIGIGGTLLDLGAVGTFVPAPYAIAFAVLGYDLWATPAPSHDH